jgi:hypothetical protein
MVARAPALDVKAREGQQKILLIWLKAKLTEVENESSWTSLIS